MTQQASERAARKIVGGIGLVLALCGALVLGRGLLHLLVFLFFNVYLGAQWAYDPVVPWLGWGGALVVAGGTFALVGDAAGALRGLFRPRPPHAPHSTQEPRA